MYDTHLRVSGMTRNNIRELRNKLKLTQQQLAKAVDSSQQQIQRIEAGIQSVRVDLAFSLCEALNATMSEVFPGTELPMARALKRKASTNPYVNDELASELLGEGFDVDPLNWIIMYHLKGGVKGSLSISGPDKQRLQNIITTTDCGSGKPHFFVFDSENRRYAMNLDHLIVCRFTYEMPDAQIIEPKEKDKFEVVFNLINAKDPLKVSVIPDEESLDRHPEYDGEAQLQDVFDMVQPYPDTYISFFDEDNEEIFIKSSEISMFSASLLMLGNFTSSNDAEHQV